MAKNNTILSHEGKIHGKINFPYAVYHGRIPLFLKNYPLHWHEEFEIICIMDGKLTVQVHSEKYECSQGDLVLIPPGAVHQIQQCGSDTCFYFNILFKFSLLEPDEESYMYKKYFLPLLNENGIEHYIPENSALGNELLPVVNHLIVNREKKYNNQELVIKAKLFLLIEKIQGAIKNDFPNVKDSSSISRLKPLIRKIDENYGEDISIADAADICAMSETYFMKFFKKMTGMTFVEYLKNVRLEKALLMLKSSPMSVSQIAEQCGFHNFSYFIRSFKKHFGVTPKQIQK